MKKHHAKKSLSLFLALLMLITAVPLTAVPAAAAGGTQYQSGVAVISSNGGRHDGNAKSFTICSDGARDQTSIGFIDYDISGLKYPVENARLDISGKNSGNSNYNGEAFLEIFSINPNNRPGVSGATNSFFDNIFGSEFKANSYISANNAKAAIGVLNQPALAVMRSKDMDNNQTKWYGFNITEAVNNALKAGQKKLCLAFLNPRSYKGSPSWSDITVYYGNAGLAYTEAGTKEAALSKGTALYGSDGGNPRGTESRLTVCNDGAQNNTVASFLKFDISSISANAASVSLNTTVSVAGSSNPNAYAEVYSVKPSKYPTSGNEWQTMNNFGKILGSGGANAYSTAKTYFSDLMDKVGTITTKQTGSVSIDVTSAVQKAKSAGQTELCLMLINPESYNNGSNGWSDIYINPQQTKLTYSETSNVNAYGDFNSGKYYVKLVTEIRNNRWWNNLINEAWIGFYYKPSNGTGEEVHIDMPVAAGTFADPNGDKVLEYVLDGFPTRIDIDCGGIANTNNFECWPKSLWVGSSAGNYTQLTGYDSEGIWKLASQGQDKRKTVIWNMPNAQYPYATTFDWKNSPSNTFVPRSDEATNTVLGSVVAKDQYGVVMGTEYTAEINKLSKNNIPISNTGLSVSKAGKADFTVSVAEGAKVANTDKFKGQLVVKAATANTTYSNTAGEKLFEIENQKEHVTIDPNNGTLSRERYDIYYGSALNAEINKALNENAAWPPTGTREGYTLEGIYGKLIADKIEDTKTIYNDAAYEARWAVNKYTVTFLDADGNVLTTRTVEYGAAATAPTAPKKAFDETNHYTFEKWDTDFSNVKSDLTVRPVYTTEAHNLQHDPTRDIEAKCEQNGQDCYACECGYYEYKDGQKAPGHDWKENSRVSATCEKNGSVTYICDRCRETKTEVLSATGHNYVETVITEATCETDGLKKFFCSKCKKYQQENGKDKEEVITALGHDWTEWEISIEATCEKDGSRKRLCKRDGCKYKTTYYTEVINKSGHKWSDEIFTEESTCTVKGYTYKKCTNKDCTATYKIADLSLADHTPGDWETLVENTCTNGGTEVRKCTVCKSLVESRATAPLGHDYQNYTHHRDATCTEPAKEIGTCSRCSATDIRNKEGSAPLGHDWGEYVYQHNATCTEDGDEIATCKREGCTAKDTQKKENSALGHDFKDYKSDNNATCEEDGTKTAKCSRCDATDTVADEGSKKDHNVANWTANNDATCQKDGTKHGFCSSCNKEVTVTDYGSKKPHSFTNYQKDKDATCLVEASEIASCDYGCGTTDIRYVEGTKGEHNFPDPEKEPEKYTPNNDATCKQKGTMSAYCTVCKKAKKTVEDPNSEMKHRIVYWISDGNATCTEDGTKHGKCVYCGEYKEEKVPDEGSRLGHWFRDYKYDNNAACENDGTRTATCERKGCDATETVTAKNTALGHDWSDWAFTEGQDKVNCTTGGTQERHCKRDGCSKTENRDVAALGHTWTWVTVEEEGNEADCERGYYKIKECSVCHEKDEASKVEVAGGAHNYVVSEYVEPTCTNEGRRVVSCSVCKKEYSRTVLPATGHLNYSLDEKTVKAPTCLEEGYTGDYICDVCGEVAKNGEAIPVSSEHSYTTYVITTQATCTANAIETASCSVCGKVPVTREVPSSALGHSFTNYVADGNATCTGIATKTAKCDRCDATDTIKVYGTALGHDWSEWKTTKEATCAAKGEAEKHCLREGCSISVTKELRQLSHTEGEWITDKEPTCEETGHRYKECAGGCGTILREETIRAKGHTYEISENTATCIDDGFLTYKCTVCGDTKNGGVVHALGHDRGEWEIVKAPTCKKEGKKQARCTVCGTILATEVIEKAAHADNDGDGYCDECSADMGDPDYNGDCGCICHKKHPFMKFLYKILRFLWKLFRIRKTCYCKAIHY